MTDSIQSFNVDLQSSSKIAALNNAFRTTYQGGILVLSAGIQALPEETQIGVLHAVRTFNVFTPDNDPHQEHDFGTIIYQGHRVFFKMDYYDLALKFHSENPADPSLTQRVLTVMLADEY
ncbi:DUF3768 domain-containing protein [Vampirovibrio sp.]|uniref:DUF3768 domain-containing protein n=1 Tax=Vampirovibrio sp. TaxID=2717857 RepID=UPI0035941B2D